MNEIRLELNIYSFHYNSENDFYALAEKTITTEDEVPSGELICFELFDKFEVEAFIEKRTTMNLKGEFSSYYRATSSDQVSDMEEGKQLIKELESVGFEVNVSIEENLKS